jgi:hypothetical protein
VSADREDRPDPPPPDPTTRAGGAGLGSPLADAHDHHFEQARDLLREAALQAEFDTGLREATEREARKGVIWRIVRAFAGFALIGIGIPLLPLPGPGWLVIILGFSLLPFAWAERTINAIRRRIPGIPEDGQIPVSTWITMALVVVAATAIALLFGSAISSWLGDLWSEVWE